MLLNIFKNAFSTTVKLKQTKTYLSSIKFLVSANHLKNFSTNINTKTNSINKQNPRITPRSLSAKPSIQPTTQQYPGMTSMPTSQNSNTDSNAPSKNPAQTRSKTRMGVVGIKVGMLPFQDSQGVRHPCTVIKLDNLQVTGVNLGEDKAGRIGIQLGFGQRNQNRLNRPQRGQFESIGVNYKAKVLEFRVSKDAVVPIGTLITVRHFNAGQLVDVHGKTIGKGFQGTIKRQGFKRQAKTHGVSKAHRKPGSQGAIGVARVLPGKKSAGRMGNKSHTIRNLKIMKIDAKQNLIYMRGNVPGKPGAVIKIKDAFYKPPEIPPPYPTFFQDPYEEELPILTAPDTQKRDPFIENMPPSKIPDII